MSSKEEHSLYEGAIAVEFFPNSHRYKLKGSKEYLTSVTAVTGMLDKSRVLMPWAVRQMRNCVMKKMEEYGHSLIPQDEISDWLVEAQDEYLRKREVAADIGTAVHEYAHAYAMAKVSGDDLPEPPTGVSDEIRNGILAFLDWEKSHDVEFLETERLTYSKQFNYVGTFDLLARVNGKLVIIDFKTGSGIYNEHYYQLAAYCFSYMEETGQGIETGMLLHFDRDTGKFSVIERSGKEMTRDLIAFSGLLLVKQRERELNRKHYGEEK